MLGITSTRLGSRQPATDVPLNHGLILSDWEFWTARGLFCDGRGPVVADHCKGLTCAGYDLLSCMVLVTIFQLSYTTLRQLRTAAISFCQTSCTCPTQAWTETRVSDGGENCDTREPPRISPPT